MKTNQALGRAHQEEFLIHGVKYAFPAERGEATRGMPTAHAAPPLKGQIIEGDLPPVWPDAEGEVRGVTLEPLHKAAPKAARKDDVFVGGCTTGLFITDPAASGIRPARDVVRSSTSPPTRSTPRSRNDCATLRLAEDATPGAPLCRWRRDDLIVDVMPVNEDILGFSNRWYPMAIETAHTFDIAGHAAQVVTPALFIATKLEAFDGRGGDDMRASHDLEDIIAVVDGRPEIVNDVAAADAEVRGYIAGGDPSAA